MSDRIPIGPYHIALEKPYKIEVDCEGETVVGSSIKLGFNFRGIEWLAERKNMTQCIALLDRVCSICSNVHSMCICMTMERIGRIEVPLRGQYIRMVMAELERLHSHLLWAGVATELIGFESLFMHFKRREAVMDALESISGNRVNYSMNRIGGVNRDIQDPAKVLRVVRDIRALTETSLIPLLTTDQSVIERCKGVGGLTRKDAIALGVVGPVARASGLDPDLRRDQPFLAYSQVQFAEPVETGCDVMAHVVVRALEILEGCKIAEQALDQMPQGPIHAGEIYSVPAGEAVVRIEAPRGEVFSFPASDGSDQTVRVKVRTPTFANMPTAQAMVLGDTLADVPLVQAALDPCYSCTDR